MTLTREQFPYYLAFTKRVFSKCLRFSDETLEEEKASLRAEFILRGLEDWILDQLIVLCQAHAEAIKAAGD